MSGAAGANPKKRTPGAWSPGVFFAGFVGWEKGGAMALMRWRLPG